MLELQAFSHLIHLSFAQLKKVPKSSRILQSKSNEVRDLVQKKMLKKGYQNSYLKPKFRRACQRVAAAGQKLSNAAICDLVCESDLPAAKLYTKVMDV